MSLKVKVKDKSIWIYLAAGLNTFQAHILLMHECLLIPQNQSYHQISYGRCFITSTPALRDVGEYV